MGMKNLITIITAIMLVQSVAVAQEQHPSEIVPSAVFSEDKQPVPPPNIIYILADDMGYSDMSWQGSPIQTPNLDQLRKEGMFLERNYVQPQCSPTRIAFLTGNYPYRFGLHEHVLMGASPIGIPAEVKTIGEKMKEGGYRTAVIGKWHAGSHTQSYLPSNQGFDHSFVCIGGAISYWNYSAGGRVDIIRNGEKVYPQYKEDGEESGNTYATELWKQEAIELISGHDKQQPLFLYLPFNAPHVPFHAPQKVLDKYADHEIEAFWSGPGARLKRTAQNRKIYMAMVDAMDAAIGEIVVSLEKKGMLDNTLIVFTSDNGGIPEADNRPLRSYKGDAFEGGVRVPGIAYWKGKIKPGSTSSELVYIADWYNTFAEIAGISTDAENKDGISALNVLKGEKGKRKAIPIISAARHAYITSDFSLVGTGENYYRMVERGLSNFRLYDLRTDVSQKQPVKQYPELRKRMQQDLAGHFGEVNRGYFNWDILYARYRAKQLESDHNLDFVINNKPELKVKNENNLTSIAISPVSDELSYQLQGTTGGNTWVDIGTYICKMDADEYLFPAFESDENIREYRVVTEPHFGLPLRDAFGWDTPYQPGPLSSDPRPVLEKAVLPPIDGFLPINDISGGTGIRIIEENLEYRNWPLEGGALELIFENYQEEPSLTRYFVEPLSRGKVYASLLVKFVGGEEECTGEINWLVRNGWNGPTEKQVSLSFQQDGIYLDMADPGPGHSKIWLAEHDEEVVCLVFEFELGPMGKDRLKVYLNPVGKEQSMQPAAEVSGEFTIDRLQFKLTARSGSKMIVDEIHMGRKLSDVLH
jgi:arylsulfatase A-like enzyme